MVGLLALCKSVMGQCPTSGNILTDCTTSGNLTVNGNTLTVAPGITMTVTGTLTVRNTGTLIATGANVNAGSFADGNGNNTLTGGTYSLSGTFSSGSGGDLDISGVTLVATGAASFTGADITISGSNFTMASMTSNVATIAITNSTMTTTGTGGFELEDATVSGSTLNIGGALHVDSGTSTVDDTDLDVGTGFANTTGHDAITMNGGAKLHLNNGSTMNVKGDVQNNEMYIDASHVVVTGNFDNFGAEILEVSNGGSIKVQGNYNNGGSGSTTAQDGGTIEVDGDYDNSNGSTTVDGGGMVVGGTYSGDDPVVTGGAEEGCSGGGGGCCGSSCSSLPVDLVSFDVYAEEDHVKLTWKTVSELNNSHFNIYRSRNGVEYEFLDWKSGNGTTDEEKTYMLKDYPSYKGVYYYRLHQVDYDGTEEQFQIKKVAYGTNSSESLNIYPMPISSGENFYISLPSASVQTIEVSLYNSVGMQENRLSFEQEADRIKVNTSALNLNSGVYLLKLTVGGRLYVKKIKLY